MPKIYAVPSLVEMGRKRPRQFFNLLAKCCPDEMRAALIAVRAELGEEFVAIKREAERLEAQRWDDYYRRTYGITLADYEAMYDRQDGRCAICRSDSSGRANGRMVVDHCHESGRVRALLCCGCNALVGYLETRREHLEAALAYISQHSDP